MQLDFLCSIIRVQVMFLMLHRWGGGGGGVTMSANIRYKGKYSYY